MQTNRKPTTARKRKRLPRVTSSNLKEIGYAMERQAAAARALLELAEYLDPAELPPRLQRLVKSQGNFPLAVAGILQILEADIRGCAVALASKRRASE